MQYFFHLDSKSLTQLRPAEESEIVWYNELADILQEYQRNIDRFERVDQNYNELIAVTTQCQGKTMLQIEREVRCAVANFLYAFNECIDHWKTYIHRSYGKESAYYKRYTELTRNAYDQFAEYRMTYGLRNYQHVDWVVQRVSVGPDFVARPFTNRDIVLRDGNLNATQKEALRQQDEWIELIPIFNVAKKQLEQINVKLMFYPVTPELESRVADALRFKESLAPGEGSLLLGTWLDENGNELSIDQETIETLANNQATCHFSYGKEIPWGVCRLIQFFQGTDYKNC